MFPTLDEVKIANRIKLCTWHRHLRSGTTPEEWEVQELIYKRFLEEGGFTSEISKRVGW